MEFNKEARIMLREAVNQKIMELKNTIDHKEKFERLPIDKEWIDILLFDEHIDKDGYHYKTIGYTYDNLRYIDLSDVSFEDVCFDFRNYGCDETLSEDEKNKMIISFTGTNAKIDFMKSYGIRKNKQLILSNISFAGLDLSNNNYTDEHGVSVFYNALVVNCDLRDTGLKITTPEVHFYDSKLRHIDLSNLEMHLYDVINSFSNCDLRNTGLNIKIYDNIGKDSIAKAMQNPNYEGCRLGKTKITSKREKAERAAGIYYDYEAWRNAMIDDVLYDLEKFVNGDPKKSDDSLIGDFFEDICLPEEDTNTKKENKNEKQKKSKSGKKSSIKSSKNEESANMIESTGSGSFYGCDNVPEVKKTSEGKKLKNTMNLGSFYGCGNVPGEE